MVNAFIISYYYAILMHCMCNCMGILAGNVGGNSLAKVVKFNNNNYYYNNDNNQK